MQILVRVVSTCRFLLALAFEAPSASVIAKIRNSASLSNLIHRIGMGNTNILAPN